MNKNNDFLLYTEVLNYSNYIRKYSLNKITTVQRDLKIHLLDEIYNLKRYLIEAQYTKGNIRVKNITEMLVSIAMIDILTTEIIEKYEYFKEKYHNNVVFIKEGSFYKTFKDNSIVLWYLFKYR